MTRYRLCVALATLALALSSAGCFDRTANPAATRQGASTTVAAGSVSDVAIDSHFDPHHHGSPTPLALLSRISEAFAARGPEGVHSYSDALCDSTGPITPAFLAFNDPAVLEQYRLESHVLPPDPTDIATERRFFSYVTTLYPKWRRVLTWSLDETSPADQVDPAAGRATLYRRYRLEVASHDGAAHHVIAIGMVTLDLVRSGQRWQVRRWNDRVDPAVGVHPLDPDQRSMGWRRLASLTQ